MKSCVLLTMDDCTGYCIYDHYLHAPLKAAGWKPYTISWQNKTCKWDDYDVVIIRSTWDYQQHKEKFLQVLTDISQTSAILENKLEIVKWNIDKWYLRDLENNGCDIIPTIWPVVLEENILREAFDIFNTNRLIIKPRVSANADNTIIIKNSDINDNNYISELQKIYKNRSFLLQPFIQNIQDEGEYSVFYFAGEYSHTILKKPQPGDFRVQEEHGGILQRVNPEYDLLKAAAKVNDYLGHSLLYARLDFVRGGDNQFYIMEVELIEPSLYFNLDEMAANRFVAALERLYK